MTTSVESESSSARGGRETPFAREASLLFVPSSRSTSRSALCVDVLSRSGWSPTEGCGIVARSLQENGFPLRGRIDSPPWKSVKGWRDRFTKLPEGDQTRETYEGLKPHLDFQSPMTREQAQDFVKGQLREVLSNMGNGVLE
jgi:hypothetical protein